MLEWGHREVREHDFSYIRTVAQVIHLSVSVRDSVRLRKANVHLAVGLWMKPRSLFNRSLFPFHSPFHSVFLYSVLLLSAGHLCASLALSGCLYFRIQMFLGNSSYMPLKYRLCSYTVCEIYFFAQKAGKKSTKHWRSKSERCLN